MILTRWVIRVTYPSGHEAFVRNGASVGRGPIATWHSKARAEAHADFVRAGADQGVIVTVVEHPGTAGGS